MKYPLALFLLISTQAWAGNFAECILDRLPDTENDVAAGAIWRLCQTEHPGGIESVQQGSGRGILGFNSGNECTAKKAVDTRSHRAAVMIGSACRRLYDEDGPWQDYQRR